MGRRRAPSLEQLSNLIADVHDAGVDGAAWPAALRRLSDLFGVPRAAIWMQDKAGGFRALPDDVRRPGGGQAEQDLQGH